MTEETQGSGTVVEFPQIPRKPRLALMGEFSAGKSTLANLLVGADRLPMQVTATQLPPVWISRGAGLPFRVDLSGEQFPVNLARLSDVPIAQTAYVRIFQDAPMLALCDIIDMPGISDPNMPAEIWQRMLPLADGIIWCTHATQAWRQSESAIWSTMPPELQRHSLLLLTRIDKIVNAHDRQRIVKRLARETEGLFAGDCLPISLTQALAAGGDPKLWEASGAAAFYTALTALVGRIGTDSGTALPEIAPIVTAPIVTAPIGTAPLSKAPLSKAPLSKAPIVTATMRAAPVAASAPPNAQPGTVLPRRIRMEAGMSGASRRPDQTHSDARLAAFRRLPPQSDE